MNTTLNKIKEQSPCEDIWQKLLESLNKTNADSEKLEIKYILKTLGVKDACWALKCVEKSKENQKKIRLMCADFAESVLHIYEEWYPNDSRVRDCIQATRDFANGKIIQQQLDVVAAAANTAYNAARVPWVSRDVWAAARVAVRVAAMTDAVWAAADAANKEKQRTIMLKYI